jgi:Fe-S-cluster-containing dehydrogenase component/formate-dependent nitrite reductase membrane component NrfD
MNFGFIIDNRKCIGCHACTVACKSENEVPLGVNRTWVKYIEKGTFPDTRRLFSVMRCNHCADAPCVEICPVTALFTRKDGIVDFDTRRCIGCKACTQACPYDALYMHPDEHTAAKCNYCSHRTDIGLEPACVIVCPEHAIISGDMDDPKTEISQLLARESVQVRKPEKGTQPKLYYIDGDAASLKPTEANPDTNYMWSSQSTGVGHYAKFAEERIKTNADKSVPQALYQIESKTRGKGTKEKARRVYDAPGKGVHWGWEVTAYVWTKAIAAGAFLIPFLFLKLFAGEVPDSVGRIGAALAIVFLGITGLLLIKDLGKPERFLYVLLRPQWKSWLVRGAYFITGYGLILSLWWAAKLAGINAALPYLEWTGVVFALLTAVYTAFLFAQAKGRDFWQSPMLGVHMILHSVMAGISVFAVAGLFLSENADWLKNLRFLAIGAIVFHLLTLIIELWTAHTTDDAKATIELIKRGRFRVPFWAGMVFLGNVLPLILLFFGQTATAALSGILILIGLYIAEHIWVRAPQMIPLS